MSLDQLIADHPDMFRGLYRVGEPRRKTAPAITYQVEPFNKELQRELSVLIDPHYEEIAGFKDIQKLDPDWETYEALERSGRLWVMTVRDRGILVGYMVMVVFRNLHYKSLLMATEDLHFLLPAYRKGLTGYRLLAKTKQALKAKGVQMMTMRTKAGNSHALLFERLDGTLQDLVYAFVL